MKLPPSVNIKRNHKCPCGSGKKLKHCCLSEVIQIRDAINSGKTKEEIMANRIFNRTSEGEQNE